MSGFWEIFSAVSGPSLVIIAGTLGYVKNKFAKYESQLVLKDQVIETQKETIRELRQRESELKVTGIIVDRFFSQLPAAPPDNIRKEIS